MLQITGTALIASLLALIVKEQKPNIAFLLTIFTGSAIFLFLIDQIYEIIRMIEEIARNAKVNQIYVDTILKIIGIAYIVEFASQITKDAGQGTIASKIEMAGKIIILAMAVPIITTLIEMILQMIPS
ncbi:stage III sporulation protein AD [Fervidibacillus halotolerans]|uniref:Stage III sporulation protein AD n=1 Tax=Fervidibacillus halotolerans TaxID=2980027 RepID=A0A9E8M286_9BACI|nr:stage III sporulation protein AD [Fervidibacillus halotolerans]WAA13926.1 stage III sporulation protein AD [Fervidibacillus halotolerans]